MPVRPLPSNPSLDHLKHQAKDLLREHTARLPETAQKIREFHPRFHHASDAEIFGAKLRVSDAQLTLAREHGFASWARLKRRIEHPTRADRLDLPHHERIEDAIFRWAVDLADAGEVTELRALLQQHPGLVHQRVLFEGGNYFRSPTLLAFVAENPIRHGRMPSQVLEVARAILEAGPDAASRDEALMLVATGSVARESGMQTPLIDLLCEFGADPDSAATRAAAVRDEHASVQALIRRGAKVNLPIAAALGLEAEVGRLLATASAEERHLALAMAAQFGHAEIVQRLLEAGEDPDRYTSHATPLHQAALAGHEAVVRVLVEHGARLDLKDVLWHGTPADWAAHEGKTEVETYLREEQSRLSR